MKANTRVRDLRRRSNRRLVFFKDGSLRGTTTFPLGKKSTQHPFEQKPNAVMVVAA